MSRQRVIPFATCAAVIGLALAATAAGQSSPQAVFEQVQQQLSDGQPQRAVDIAEESIRQYDDQQQAFQVRVRVARLVLDYHLEEGNGKAALEQELETLVENSEGSTRELAHLMAGRIYIFINEYEAARTLLQAYLEEFPRPSRDALEQYAKEDETPEAAARRHPRLMRRRVAREMLGRLELVGREAPPFQVTSLAGDQVSRESLQGNPAVLVFWRASSDQSTNWMNLLRNVYRQHRDSGLQIVGFSVDTQKSQLDSFLEEQDLPWTQVFLGGRRQEVCSKFGVSALYPASVLIDSQGVIRGVDLKGTVLARQIDSLVSGSAASSDTE